MKFRSGFSSLSKTKGGAIIRSLGLVFAFGLFAEICVFYALGSTFIFEASSLVGIASMLPFLAGSLYAPYWLPGSESPAARHPRLVRWWICALFCDRFRHPVV